MKQNRWIYFLITLLPLLDLITSIQTRFNASFFSIGIIVKGIVVLLSTYYIIFKSSSKYKKTSILFLGSIILFLLFYFGFKTDLLSFSFLKTEIAYLFKILFMPIIFLALLNYFDEYGFEKKSFIKTMIITLIEYTLLLLVPLLLNIAFDSYSTGLHGYVGWFYAANEISVIILLLLPFMYYLLNKNKKYNFIIALPIIYAVAAIGTKVTFIGAITVAVLTVIFMFIGNKGKLNNLTIGSFLILLITLFFFLIANKTTVDNVQILAESHDFEFIKTPIVEEPGLQMGPIPLPEEVKEKPKIIQEIISFLLSNRDDYYYQTKDIYEANYEKSYFLFGMGFSNTYRINNSNIDKLIEIDYLDLYYHTGVIGLLINIMPLFYLFFKVLRFLFSKMTNLYNTCFIFYNSLIVLMTLAVAGIAGHVLYFPAVSFYLILYIIFILNETNLFVKKEINDRKVNILALHLNYGGIENVLTNQANILSKNYDVEILCLYNSHKNPAFELNNNVKITYLTNTISNKKEFITAIKSFKIIKVLNEGFKALKILLSKNVLIKKAIINSDAKVIISTRKEFSILLGKYARNGVVTIGEEHNYHDNNSKYIKSVIKCNKNIDYFLPTSKELYDFYLDKVKAKVIYIPNVLNYYPKKTSKLDSKKIVCIGRLSKEKGIIDLVNVMREIVKKDKGIILDIYGDGEEKENIVTAIKNNKLDKNINLKGFVSPEKLRQELNKYSTVISPSHKESFGLAVLECMSFGIPCVCFDSAKGPLEFVNEGTGIVIENRNIKKMADSIISLLNDSKRIESLGKNALSISKNYSIEKVSPLLNDFIENAIKVSLCKERNVMFISSTGGHLNELLQLRKMFDKYNYALITEKTKTNKDLKNKYIDRVNYLIYGTRFHPLPYFLFILPFNCILSLIYYIKYRPEFIISTGAHTAGPMCCIGKIFGSKIIYIETFANIHTKTATGKIVYKFADIFVVQWESMLELYPDAIYGGWIF